jgi:hypothetical protein
MRVMFYLCYLCLFVYSGVQLLVLLYVFTFLVLCSVFCDVHYDCHIKRCSVRLYSQLLLGGLMSYLCYLCLFAYSEIKHVLYIRVTWRVSYKRQELLTLRELLCSPSVFWWGPVIFLVFCIVLCCVFICFCFICLCPVSSIPYFASISGLSIFNCPSVFYDVYLRYAVYLLVYIKRGHIVYLFW